MIFKYYETDTLDDEMQKLSDRSSDYYKSQDKILNPAAERSDQMSHILYVLGANCHLLAAFAFSKLIKHHVTDQLKLREIHTAKYYVPMKIKCCLVRTHKAFLSCLQGDWSRGQKLNAEETKYVFTAQQNKKNQHKDTKKYSEHAGRMVEIFRYSTNYTLIHDETMSRLNIENVC